MAAGPTAALAQTQPVVTRPVVTSLGPDFPKTGIFISNSFYYYNNGLPGHLSLMEKAAEPDHKQDYRNTMVTIGGSMMSKAISGPMRSAVIPSTTTTTSSSTS